jgi:hypothetical protein
LRYGLSAGISFVFMIVLCSVLFPPMFTIHAQGATPEREAESERSLPPTPTPVVIVIGESVSVGVNGPPEPFTETIAVQDSVSTVNPITEALSVQDSTPVIHFLAENMATEDQRSGQASREKNSKDPFARSTGTMKEGRSEPVSETPEGTALETDIASGGGGSIWLIVVYVVVGLVVAGSLAVLGRRFIRAGTSA